MLVSEAASPRSLPSVERAESPQSGASLELRGCAEINLCTSVSRLFAQV